MEEAQLPLQFYSRLVCIVLGLALMLYAWTLPEP